MSALTYLLTMELLFTITDQLTTDQWEVRPLISVLLATVLIEKSPESVGVTENGVELLQCAGVRNNLSDARMCSVMCHYFV